MKYKIPSEEDGENPVFLMKWNEQKPKSLTSISFCLFPTSFLTKWWVDLIMDSGVTVEIKLNINSVCKGTES